MSGFTIHDADLVFLTNPNLPHRYVCPDCCSVRSGRDIILRLSLIPASDHVYSLKTFCRYCRDLNESSAGRT